MSLSNEYPDKCVIQGEEFSLVSESRWLRRFKSKSGKFHVASRLLDGSFDPKLFDTLSIKSLSEAEKRDAALAIKVSGREDIPREWRDFVRSVKAFYI